MARSMKWGKLNKNVGVGDANNENKIWKNEKTAKD